MSCSCWAARIARTASDSPRLPAHHKPSYLIDRANELRSEWFHSSDTVLITAGASAPEDHVQDCVKYLVDNYEATVEHRVVREEHVSFPLPKELRVLVRK